MTDHPFPTLSPSEATLELQEEIETRCRLNPRFAQRIGNFGFLELEESWGDEATILNTARISTTNRRIKDLEAFDDRDRQLLYHLLAHNHGTPFESVYLRWRVIAPIFVLRQWMRHRICSFNEFSQRYRTPITACFVPDAEARTVQGFQVMTDEQTRRYEALMASLHQFYQTEYEAVCRRLEEAEARGEIEPSSGGRNPYRARARELLRNAMPVSTYSDLYWTINFRSLMNFFSLRRKPDAQREIRVYADCAFAMFQRRFPLLAETMTRVLEEQDTRVS